MREFDLHGENTFEHVFHFGGVSVEISIPMIINELFERSKLTRLGLSILVPHLTFQRVGKKWGKPKFFKEERVYSSESLGGRETLVIWPSSSGRYGDLNPNECSMLLVDSRSAGPLSRGRRGERHRQFLLITNPFLKIGYLPCLSCLEIEGNSLFRAETVHGLTVDLRRGKLSEWVVPGEEWYGSRDFRGCDFCKELHERLKE